MSDAPRSPPDDLLRDLFQNHHTRLRIQNVQSAKSLTLS